MEFGLLFPGKYLKSAEFKGLKVTLTIASVKLEELETQKGPQTKGVIAFRETKKLWVLNRTNAECLKAMWKGETDRWVGKRVTLWPAPYTDHMTGEVSTAIRVFGSPDIAADITATIALARKKPFPMRLAKVGPQANGKAPPSDLATNEPPPPGDHDAPPMGEEGLP